MKNWARQHYDYLVLLFSIIVSAILRIVVPFTMVFQNGRVIFNTADAYYHMRYVDLILANYPNYQFSDSYLKTNFGVAPFWDLIIAWFGHTFGNVDLWAAYLPAIIGVLILIPIFFITKQIFNRKLITSVAVGLGAIISGLFFARTQLGATDQHVLEIFLLTSIMFSVIYAIKAKSLFTGFGYFILIPIFMGLYYLTWGLPSIFVICSILILFFYISLILYLYDKHRKWFMVSLGMPILGIIVILLAHVGYFGYFGDLIRYAVPLTFSSTIGEEWPLLFSYSSIDNMFMDLSVTWGYFGLLFIMFLVGIGMLLYRVIKYKYSQEILLLSWTIVMFVLTLIMRRWAYYFAVNVVILSALSIVVIIKALVVQKGKVNVKGLIFACVIGVAFIVVPFIRNDIGLARNQYNYSTKGWQEASTFLRSQLTESQDAEYYRVYKDDDIMTTPYVLSWWDYGYYLAREAHMPVLAHGAGIGFEKTAKLLLSNDADIVEQLKKQNIKYIVIDNRMAVEYFYAIVDLAGQDIDNYYQSSSKTIERTYKYYDTLLARLYILNNIGGIGLVHSSDEVKIFEVE